VASPPNVPEGRAEALREAFLATMKDPRAGIEIDRPVDGPTVEAVLKTMYASSPTAIEKVLSIRHTK